MNFCVDPFTREPFDFRTKDIELTLTRPFWSAEFDALRLLLTQRFRRPLRNDTAQQKVELIESPLDRP
jgi:hypothetical protein